MYENIHLLGERTNYFLAFLLALMLAACPCCIAGGNWVYSVRGLFPAWKLPCLSMFRHTNLKIHKAVEVPVSVVGIFLKQSPGCSASWDTNVNWHTQREKETSNATIFYFFLLLYFQKALRLLQIFRLLLCCSLTPKCFNNLFIFHYMYLTC